MQWAFQRVTLCSSLHTMSIPDSCPKSGYPLGAFAGSNQTQCVPKWGHKETTKQPPYKGKVTSHFGVAWGTLGNLSFCSTRAYAEVTSTQLIISNDPRGVTEIVLSTCLLCARKSGNRRRLQRS